jgi:hypothetical protein
MVRSSSARKRPARFSRKSHPASIAATLALFASVAYATTQGADSGWNAYFDTRIAVGAGWQTSDGAQTAALPGGRVIWQFGDTATNGSYPYPVLNNSIAVHDTGTTAPVTGTSQMRFYARLGASGVEITTSQTIDRAWFPSVVDATSGIKKTWWWPDAPYVNAATNTADLFFSSVGCAGTCAYPGSTFLGAPQDPSPRCCDDHGVKSTTLGTCASSSAQPVCPAGYSTTKCGYETCRLADMRITGVYELEQTGVNVADATQWTYPGLPIPISNPGFVPANPMASPVRIEWGQSFVRAGGYIYIFGTRHSAESSSRPGWPSAVYIARATPENVRDYTTWTFLLASVGAWTHTPPNQDNCNDADCSYYRALYADDSSDLALRPPRQLSVQYVNWQGAARWVVIENHPASGNTLIDLRVATGATGGDWGIAYSFDGHAYDSAFTTNSWSVWAHPELSVVNNTTKEYWLRFSYWAGGAGELHFQNFPLHQIRPWCTLTGHTCLN